MRRPEEIDAYDGEWLGGWLECTGEWKGGGGDWAGRSVGEVEIGGMHWERENLIRDSRAFHSTTHTERSASRDKSDFVFK